MGDDGLVVVRRGINRTGLPALGREESWDVKDPICSAVVGDSLPALPPVCEPHQPPLLPRGCTETDKQHGHYHWCLKGGEGPARRGSWPLGCYKEARRTVPTVHLAGVPRGQGSREVAACGGSSGREADPQLGGPDCVPGFGSHKTPARLQTLRPVDSAS